MKFNKRTDILINGARPGFIGIQLSYVQITLFSLKIIMPSTAKGV